MALIDGELSNGACAHMAGCGSCKLRLRCTCHAQPPHSHDALGHNEWLARNDMLGMARRRSQATHPLQWPLQVLPP
eukprot:5341259-Amphidinium_carterae.1